ncbi:retinol dehydrogenase 12-like [Phlebotomus argentipes]|uniref:retinol dehydrogenase 12-like n=1 Tax=Phlebotomus argentipes TaxID=94469 RepID=UPI002892CEB1|nr:retinol dehydrogenase 12-like [Phlebotomus argentipes]
MSLLYILIPVGVGAALYVMRKLRERHFGWVRNNSSLKDRIFVVTGANTGLGFETTRALVHRHATVIMACRNMEKAQEAITAIRKETGNGFMIPLELDLASFDSIKSFAAKLIADYPHFDCLINNAGLALRTEQTTKEGLEMHFGVNHVGHFLLTSLLSKRIKENAARVVVVSSKMHEKVTVDVQSIGNPISSSRRGNPNYNASKLANFLFAKELYKKGYDAHVLCPGLCHTDFFRDYNPKWYHYVLFSPIAWWYLRSARQGAQNIIHCATDNVNTEEKNPGKNYFVVNLKQTKSKARIQEGDSETLWKISEQKAGIKFE